MRKWMLTGVAAGLFLVHGCETLPEGEPPQDPIVESAAQEQKREFTEKNAVNHMLTSMITKCDRFNSGSVGAPKIRVDFKGDGRDFAKAPGKVLSDLVGMGMAERVSTGGELVLESRMKSLGGGRKEWEMSLRQSEGGEVVWSETVVTSSGEGAR